MKKHLAVSILACTFSAPAAQAVDIYTYDEPYPPMSTEQAAALGGGAVVGALLAGPLGAFIGGAGGGLLANNREYEDKLTALQEKLSLVQQQAANLQQQNRLLLQQKVSASPATAGNGGSGMKLYDALARGFSFSVQFRNNHEALESQYIQQLHDVSKAFVGIPALHVHLSGHADRNGANSYNQGLSEKRVQAVAAVIRRAGWPAERMHIAAHGESRPISTPDDIDGYPFDRRVTISFGAKGAGI